MDQINGFAHNAREGLADDMGTSMAQSSSFASGRFLCLWADRPDLSDPIASFATGKLVMGCGRLWSGI
jgi:hypothetical protein